MKKVSLLFVVAFLSLTAVAQQPPQQEKYATVKLSASQWDYIIEVLNEMPAKKANPIMNQIVNQALPQLNPPAKTDSTKAIVPKKKN